MQNKVRERGQKNTLLEIRRKMHTPFALTLLVLASYLPCRTAKQNQVGAWYNPFSWFEDAVDEIAEDLDKVVDHAGEVFTRVVNDAFRNNIDPLVDKIQTFVEYDINEINKDVQQTIDHVENSTKSILSFAEQQAELFLNVSIAAMEKAVKDAMQQLSSLADQVTQDLDQLLEKLADILTKIEKDFRFVAFVSPK
jgi:ElaB/YqjD/DUF883 family membrane-anchored ribosome-binding protein